MRCRRWKPIDDVLQENEENTLGGACSYRNGLSIIDRLRAIYHHMKDSPIPSLAHRRYIPGRYLVGVCSVFRSGPVGSYENPWYECWRLG